MGDIADAIVDGEICQICCGNPPDEPQGYPFTCTECGGTGSVGDVSNKSVPVQKLECPECGKKFKGDQGVRDHMRDKHGKTSDT